MFSNELLKYIINDIEKEEGVRNLKRAINNITSWINMMIYVPIDSIKISLPFNVTNNFYDTYCKKKYNNTTYNYNTLYI